MHFRKEAEAKDIEHNKMFKDAFERIKQVVASDASLDEIVADFIKVEDQNFALFNYVTEMNNQVEGLQESIAKFRIDIKEAKGRGDERERQQRDQLNSMERRVALSIREADMTEAKLDLMEGVIIKLKSGVEELYMQCQVGSTPVLSLLGGLFKTEEVQRPSVNENNIIMYLDMVNERVIELKSIAQFVDAQAKLKESGRKDTLQVSTFVSCNLTRNLKFKLLVSSGCQGPGRFWSFFQRKEKSAQENAILRSFVRKGRRRGR